MQKFREQSNRDKILQELQVIISDERLATASRSQKLLCYLVDRKLDDPTCHISVQEIFRDVYDVKFAIDANDQPRVRVAISRLRRILDEIYRTRPSAGVRICLPLGSYVPQFQYMDSSHDRRSVAPTLPIRFFVDVPASHSDPKRASEILGIRRHFEKTILQLPEYDIASSPENSDLLVRLDTSSDIYGHQLACSLRDAETSEVLWADAYDYTPGNANVAQIVSALASRTIDPFTGCVFPFLARKYSSHLADTNLGLTCLHYALVRTHDRNLIQPLLQQLDIDCGDDDLGEARRNAIQADVARIKVAHGFSGNFSDTSVVALKKANLAYRLSPSDPISQHSLATSEIAFGDHKSGVALLQNAASSDESLPILATDAAVLSAFSGSWDTDQSVPKGRYDYSQALPYYAGYPALLSALRNGNYDLADVILKRSVESGSIWSKVMEVVVLQTTGESRRAKASAESLTSDYPSFREHGRDSLGAFLKDGEMLDWIFGKISEAGVEVTVRQ